MRSAIREALSRESAALISTLQIMALNGANSKGAIASD
jgi:hypothetical protein